MSIAVIVVNYSAADLAIEAVQSVLDRNHEGRAVEVHLVDNASPSDDATTIQAAFEKNRWSDRVTLYLEGESHGFGRGNNVALRALAERETPPEFVFLLNPDAILENETLDILAQDLENNPDAVATGAGIALPDGTPVAAAFRWPHAKGEVAQVIGFGPISRLLGDNGRALPPDHSAGPVDWVSGVAVMMRFDAVEKAGFFDPGYFLYYEEVDLMRTLTDQGGQIRYQPAARVRHAEGASTGVRSGEVERRRSPAYLYRSWRRYFAKEHARLPLFLLALSVWFGAILGYCVTTLRRKRNHLPLNAFGDQARYLLGPLSGLKKDPIYEAESARVAQPTIPNMKCLIRRCANIPAS